MRLTSTPASAIPASHGGGLVRPHQLVGLVLELDQVGGGEHVLAGGVELDAVIAHHQLFGLEIGRDQRGADLSGSVEPARFSASASVSMACRLRALVSSRSRPVLRLVHLVDLVGRGAEACRYPARAAVHDPCAMSATAGMKEDRRNRDRRRSPSAACSRGSSWSSCREWRRRCS